MNSERFHLQQSAESAYLIIDLEESEQLDDIAIQVIQDDCPEFLLPLHISALNGRRSLRYKLMTATALKYSMGGKMSKAEFVDFAIKLLTPFVKCKNWFLDYHYLCIDPTHILYDKSNERFMYVYMPEKSLYNTDEEIINFFEKILTNIDIVDDQRYQIMLIRYFRDDRVLLSELYQMFTREKGNSTAVKHTETENVSHTKNISEKFEQKSEPVKPKVVETPVKQSENITVTQPTKQAEPAKKFGIGGLFGSKKPKKEEKNLFDDDILGDFGGDFLDDISSKKTKKSSPESEKTTKSAKSDNKGGFFGGFNKSTQNASNVSNVSEKPAEPAATQNANVPMSQQPMYDPYGGDVTTIPGGDTLQRRYLELIDHASPDEPPKVIELDFNKEYITIGREASNGSASDVDVKFPPRCGVSRHHLRIYDRDGKLIAVDLGSAYFTLINGQRLTPNIEYELTDGATLTFAEKQPIRYHVHC